VDAGAFQLRVIVVATRVPAVYLRKLYGAVGLVAAIMPVRVLELAEFPTTLTATIKKS
jgi:hypothetical protein